MNKVLGGGTSGKVYLATDKHDNKVAIKEIKINMEKNKRNIFEKKSKC